MPHLQTWARPRIRSMSSIPEACGVKTSNELSMTRDLEAVNIEVLQERLLEEVDAHQRLQDELKTALETERSLRLENELLWTYLQRKYPSRVEDAAELLTRLTDGAELSAELQTLRPATDDCNRPLGPGARRRRGTVPGVPSAYHGIKNIGKYPASRTVSPQKVFHPWLWPRSLIHAALMFCNNALLNSTHNAKPAPSVKTLTVA